MEEAFFYKLDEAFEAQIYDDKLVEMIRRQLEVLMDTVIFTNKKKEVEVDGFKLRCDQEKCYIIDVNK